MPEITARYLRVDRRNLVYLQFIVESYEGLAVVTTVDPKEAVVRVSFPACRSTEVDDLVRELRAEISLKDVPEPGTGSPADPSEEEIRTNA